MNEKKDNYLKRYLKENLVVLLFELVIVVLLACICSLMLGGEPVWLAPALAVFAYLMAELRFMMSYIASCARQAKQENEDISAQEDESAAPQDALEDAEQDPGQALEESLVEDLDEDEDVPFVPPVIKHTEELFDESFFDEPISEDFDQDVEENAEGPLNEPEQVELPWAQEPLETVELGDELFEKQDGDEELLVADIDLFDESSEDEDLLEDEDIYNIFTPPVSQPQAPTRFDIPVQGVLDLGDDEDPFSH